MLKYSNIKQIDCSDLDNLVVETYGKPYCFQQQAGCQSRGSISIDVSKSHKMTDFLPEKIKFKINGGQHGVNFQTWLNTTIEEINEKHPQSYPSANNLFWHRSFYPDLDIVVHDLCKKGLIEEGSYEIKIDW